MTFEIFEFGLKVLILCVLSFYLLWLCFIVIGGWVFKSKKPSNPLDKEVKE